MGIIRARPVSFFWVDTDVFDFSLPITNVNIFVLLKQYLFCLMRQQYYVIAYASGSQTFFIATPLEMFAELATPAI